MPTEPAITKRQAAFLKAMRETHDPDEAARRSGTSSSRQLAAMSSRVPVAGGVEVVEGGGAMAREWDAYMEEVRQSNAAFSLDLVYARLIKIFMRDDIETKDVLAAARLILSMEHSPADTASAMRSLLDAIAD